MGSGSRIAKFSNCFSATYSSTLPTTCAIQDITTVKSSVALWEVDTSFSFELKNIKICGTITKFDSSSESFNIVKS